jgi:4-amino-4-deoxy-L-arabinose transferase-like glycosyltransferase
MLKKYNFYIHILIILVFSLGIRISFFYQKSGAICAGDSREYMEVIENISNGYGFSRVDIADGQMKPYSNKPPLFFYISSLFHKILNGKLENDIIILNFLSSILTLLLWLYITYLITENKKITIITGWILSINPNLIYNSLTIMSDTFYLLTFSLFVLFFILSIKKKNKYLFFISGISMGISVLTRTVLKAFWIFGIIFIIFFLKDEFKKKIRYSLLFLAGHLLIVLPYHIRNYIAFNSPSPIEFHQGIALSASITSIIPLTNYKELIQKYPIMNEIIEIIKTDKNKGIPDKELMKKLNINDFQLAQYLTKLTIYTATHNTLLYLKVYFKNILNYITSSSSCLLIIDIFKNGYYKYQHILFLKFISNERLSKNEFMKIMPNILLRAFNMLVFILFVISFYYFFKYHPINKEINLFVLILICYIIAVSSLTPAYDRYRLPIDFFIWYYISCFLEKFMLKI